MAHNNPVGGPESGLHIQLKNFISRKKDKIFAMENLFYGVWDMVEG